MTGSWQPYRLRPIKCSLDPVNGFRTENLCVLLDWKQMKKLFNAQTVCISFDCRSLLVKTSWGRFAYFVLDFVVGQDEK